MNILTKTDSLLRGILRKFFFKVFSEKAGIFLLDFDVFNRHQIVTDNIIRNGLASGVILDVGGRLQSLRRFLPRKDAGKIIVLNPESCDLRGPGDDIVDAVRGDGAFLPFADKTFDVVTSITTLEHVDIKERHVHLQELQRVCRGRILIYVPVGPAGDRYERKLYRWSLDDHIKFMTKQHIDNGLPTLKELRRSLPGCNITQIQNANVWLFCMLLKQVPFLGIVLPSLLYSFLKHVKVDPHYEYLIECDNATSAPPAEGRKTILIVSKCLPRFDRGSGHVRMYEVIKLLLYSYNVTFVAEEFSLSADMDDSRYAKDLNSLGVKVFADKFKWNEIEKTPFDLVLIAWYETAIRRLPYIRRKFPAVPVIVDSVDVHFARELQMAEIHQNKRLLKKALRTKKDELAVYREADQVWAVTGADKQILLDNDPDMNIFVIPNIHDFEPVDRSNIEPNSLLFIGNFFHAPNVDAIIHFCKMIFPTILRQKPDAVLYIVGNAPTKEVRALASESVKVEGWVPDTRPYLERCHLSVVPLRYGGGLKGKVGEAMMAGIPVVTTPVGTQGMDVEDGTHLLVRSTDQDFAEGVITLLEDPALCHKLSGNSINYIKQRFSPSVVKSELNASIEQLLGHPHENLHNRI